MCGLKNRLDALDAARMLNNESVDAAWWCLGKEFFCYIFCRAKKLWVIKSALKQKDRLLYLGCPN